jgi:hypothetical protein
MTKKSIATVKATFDYDAHEIATADAKPLEKHAKVIVETQDRVRKTTAEGVLKIGKELEAARDRLARHGNGTFGTWCVERCGISRMSANRAMQAYSQFKDCNTVLQTFDATAMYLLSAESCPEDAAAEAMDRAKTGEQITAKLAKQIIKSHSPQQDDDDQEDDADDDQDAFEWRPAVCMMSVRREVKRWIAVCPDDELHCIAEILKKLVSQMESRSNDQD